jgi:trehalose 6-phosphate phosphatase
MKYLIHSLEKMKSKAARAKTVYVMVDYDGTITPIVKYPSLAKMPADTRELLRSLALIDGCVVAVVSGRSLRDLMSLVRIRQAYYIGNHGLQISGPGLNFTHSTARRLSHGLPGLALELKEKLGGIRGLLIEEKGMTISVHYRNVSVSSVPRVLRIVSEAVRERKGFQLTRGKKVIEFRPRVDWNKGSATSWFMRRFGPGFPLYFGDDVTDEDAFATIRGGMTVLVSETKRSSRARYYVKSVHEVQYVLAFLLKSLRSRGPIA